MSFNYQKSPIYSNKDINKYKCNVCTHKKCSLRINYKSKKTYIVEGNGESKRKA